MPVKAIPEGYHSVTPYLYIRGAAKAIEFYKKAFGAQEALRIPGENGKVGHAELKIGDSYIMLADEHPDMKIVGPQTLGNTSMSLLLYVEDVDQTVANSLAAGATVERPIKNQFYGDRSGTLLDPFGHKWTVATHVEDVSNEEMMERMRKAALQSA